MTFFCFLNFCFLLIVFAVMFLTGLYGILWLLKDKVLTLRGIPGLNFLPGILIFAFIGLGLAHGFTVMKNGLVAGMIYGLIAMAVICVMLYGISYVIYKVAKKCSSAKKISYL